MWISVDSLAHSCKLLMSVDVDSTAESCDIKEEGLAFP